jgi:FtsP/CotA-like multicopper oxidase with cupredoxin domain
VEGFELNAMNGASWPHTERIALTTGVPERWRVINGAPDVHMMHLHGFHYLLLATGDDLRDVVFAPADRLTIVTQFLDPGSTMAMEWVPTRPGNWIFHCHLARHMSAAQRLDRLPGAPTEPHEPTAHAMHEMAGLIIGVEVAPSPGAMADSAPIAPRKLRLLAQSRPGVFGERPGFGFVLEDEGAPLARDSIRIPGSPIIVTRDELVEITVRNHLPWPLSLHWHGIELESYFDGVAGWSGMPGSIAPPIAPGDSFVARMAPPRAGTFMYHAHNGGNEEVASGLYGPFLVLEPGSPHDPATDLVFVVSEAGPGSRPGDPQAPFVNGSTAPSPIELNAGTTYRFRFIDISQNDGHNAALMDGDTVAHGTPIALDGADFPPAMSRPQPVQFPSAPGMTTDFEFTPQRAGELRFVVAAARRRGLVPDERVTVVRIRVRQ